MMPFLLASAPHTSRVFGLDTFLGLTDVGSLRKTLFYLAILGVLAAGLVVDYRLLRRARSDPRHLLPARRLEWLAERPWIWPDFGMILLIVMGVMLFFMVGAEIVRTARWADLSQGTAATWTLVAMGLIINGSAIVLSIQLLRVRGIRVEKGLGLDLGAWPRRLGQGLVGWLALYPPLVFTVLVVWALVGQLGITPEPQPQVVQLFAERSAAALACYAILAVVVVPVGEEIFFRGILFPLLVRQAGVFAALVVGAAVFATVHFNLAALVPLFILGIACSLGYAISGSLIVPIVMHMAFNATTVVSVLLLRGPA